MQPIESAGYGTSIGIDFRETELLQSVDGCSTDPQHTDVLNVYNEGVPFLSPSAPVWRRHDRSGRGGQRKSKFTRKTWLISRLD